MKTTLQRAVDNATKAKSPAVLRRKLIRVMHIGVKSSQRIHKGRALYVIAPHKRLLELRGIRISKFKPVTV